MSRFDTQTRILRNLEIVRYQLDSQARAGMYASRLTEDLMRDCLNAVTLQDVKNLNDASKNSAGLDLISSNLHVGYQVTLRVTKAKVDKTQSVLAKAANRLNIPTDIYVVGLTCVSNEAIRRWTPLNPSFPHGPRIRAVELLPLLALTSASNDALVEVDDIVQDAVGSWGRPRKTDAQEVFTLVGWLDRPAVRDLGNVEQDWQELNEAMQEIRRLLSQGVDDRGNVVTRPRLTFLQPYLGILKEVYDLSCAISRIITPHLKVRGLPGVADTKLIDMHKRKIQLCVNKLTAAAEMPPVIW